MKIDLQKILDEGRRRIEGVSAEIVRKVAETSARFATDGSDLGGEYLLDLAHELRAEEARRPLVIKRLDGVVVMVARDAVESITRRRNSSTCVRTRSGVEIETNDAVDMWTAAEVGNE